MNVMLFGLKTCDGCRKARAALESAGRTVTVVDIREGTDLAAKVPTWLQAAGKKLLNRSSTTWRGLSETERARADGDVLVDLLINNPALIKRPVIEAGGKVYVGWDRHSQAALAS